MGTNAQPPESGGGEGGGAPDPFAAMREAGFDPDSTDWADLAAKAQYVEALTDPNRHFDTLENSLRQWGHLPEGSSLADMFAGDTDEGDDDTTPFWQQPPGQQQIIGYDGAGEPIYAAPPQAQNQPGQFDPADFASKFEERLLSQVDKRVQEATQSSQREIMAQNMVRDLEGQMETVRTANNLTDDESAFLWESVRSRLSGMDNLVDPQQVRGLVDTTWKQIDALTNARLARLADPSKRPPVTTDVAGPAPTRDAGSQGRDAFGGMMEETARRLGIAPGEE